MLFVSDAAEIVKLVNAEAVPWTVLRAVSVPVVEMVTGSGAKERPLNVVPAGAVKIVVGVVSLMAVLCSPSDR